MVRGSDREKVSGESGKMTDKLVSVSIKEKYWEQLKKLSAKYGIEPEVAIDYLIAIYLDCANKKKEKLIGKKD